MRGRSRAATANVNRWDKLSASGLIAALVAGLVVTLAAPAAAGSGPGPLTFPSGGGVSFPSAVSLTGPFSVTGTISNSAGTDQAGQLQLAVDSTSLGSSHWLDATMFTAVCQQPTASGAATVTDDTAGTVTVTCPATTVASAGGTFAVDLKLTAPAADTGQLALTLSMIDPGTLAVQDTASSSVQAKAPPQLGVGWPTQFNRWSPPDVHGFVDNSGGADPAGPVRLDFDISTSDPAMKALQASQLHLKCAIDGASLTDVTITGSDLNSGDFTGHCDPAGGFVLGVTTHSIAISADLDNAAPAGALTIGTSLDVLDQAANPITPSLATTSKTMTVTAPPTVTSNPPAILATGATQRTYAVTVDDPSNGADFAQPRLTVALTGLDGLAASQVTLTCAPFGQPTSGVQLSGSILNGQAITGDCDGGVIHAGDSGASSATATFTISLAANAPTGTLKLSTTLKDASSSPVVTVANDGNHDISVVAGAPQQTGCQTSSSHTMVWAAGGAGAWSTAANWDGGVPGPGDTAVIPPGASITGAQGQVCNLVIDGGTAPAQRTLLSGSGTIDVIGDTTISKYAGLSAGGGALGLVTHHVLSTTTGADLELDGAGISLPALGTFASGTTLHRPSSPTAGVPAVTVTGTFRYAGAASGTVTLNGVELDVQTASGTPGSVDPAGGTIALTGAATSAWQPGIHVVDSGSGGTLSVGGGATLAVDSAATTEGTAVLRVLTGGRLTDAGQGATFSGPGTLDWAGGTLAGALTLAANLQMRVVTAADQTLSAGSSLVNLGQMKLQPPSGTIDLEGDLDNRGTITIRPGVTLLRNATTGASYQGVTNEAGGKLGIEPPTTGSVVTGSPVLLNGVRLHNLGELTLPTAGVVRVRNAAVLLDGGTLSGGGTPTSSTSSSPPAPGALAIGDGATGELAGAVGLRQTAMLAVDDSSLTKAPRLVIDAGATLDAPTGTSGTAVTGVLHLCAGSIVGPGTVGKLVKTEVGVGAAAGACQAPSPVTVTVAGGADAAHLDTLVLAGPASVNNATLTGEAHSQVTFGGASALGGTVELTHAGGAADDQRYVVAQGGSLGMPALQLPGLFTTTRPTISSPFVNNGTVTFDSAVTLAGAFSNAGVATATAAVTATAPVTNAGRLTVTSTTFAARAGYTQATPAAVSGQPAPADAVTGLTGTASAFTTSDGASPAHLAPITLTSGGLGGVGTITASTVTIGATWVHPGTSGVAGTMTIAAPVVLSKKSDVQIVTYKPTSGSTPVHDVLKVTGALTLSGKVTGFTASDYTPAYLTIAKAVVTATTMTGTFTDAAWSGTPTGLGWRPRPLAAKATQVDLQLVDVAPPSLGIASISAFTEFPSQRITFAAVDNRTGVRSYDTRWRSGSAAKAFGSWHYPKTWQRSTSTSQTLTGMVTGSTYCFSVRARDKAGNVTPWSTPLCTAKMFDDASLRASSGWARQTKKAGFYFKTFTQTSRRGKTLTRSGTYTRIGVIAYRCPACGVIDIYSGKKRVKRLSLASSKAKTGLFAFVTPALKSTTGKVVLKVVSRRKNVVIDAFGLQR